MLFSQKHKKSLTIIQGGVIIVVDAKKGPRGCHDSMEIEFSDDALDRLETDAEFTARLRRDVVRSYRRRIQAIRDAVDERDLRALTSWRFKRLKGERSHQHSIRLCGPWRLIVEIREARPRNVIVVIGIEDYH